MTEVTIREIPRILYMKLGTGKSKNSLDPGIPETGIPVFKP